MVSSTCRRKGVFISFEGGDGAGKSTQIELLAKKLRETGHDVVTTREPGGSEGAEAIRTLLVTGAKDRWSPLTEALLLFAARTNHLEEKINPALARGDIVITDRFADSTMAYQGMAGALGAEKVQILYDLVIGGNGPDLTLILDSPADNALARANEREGELGGETRFEEMGLDYQKTVRQAYLDIAAAAPERCVVIDARGSIEDVETRIFAAVNARAPELFK